MVSNGPNSAYLRMTHMYDFVDLRKFNKQEPSYNKNSLMDIISCNPNYSIFLYILRLSKLDNLYNDLQANFTLFVPKNEFISGHDSIFLNMDRYTAMNIVKNLTLNNIITSDLLEDSPASYFLTNNRSSKLLITNVNNVTKINNTIEIIEKNIPANNVIIHTINGLVIPQMI